MLKTFIIFSVTRLFSSAVNVNSNSSVNLNCELALPTGYTYHWEKKFDDLYFRNIQELKVDQDDKYENVNSKTLRINYLSFDDSTFYRCLIRTNPVIYGQELDVVVSGKPILSTSQTKYTVKGVLYTLVCHPHYRTNPSITNSWWLRKLNGFKTFSVVSSGSKYSEGSKSYPVLSILNVEKADAGIYRCFAQNSRGTTYADTKLNVGDEPVVVIEKEIYYPLVSKTLFIGCSTGDSHSATWKISNSPLMFFLPSTQYSVGTIPNSDLTVYNISKARNGRYQCCGTNLFGTKCVGAQVISGSLPNVSVPSKVFYSKRMSELIVPCSVNDLNPVLWRKLTETGFVVLSNHTFSTIAVGTSLMILSVAESEDGEYQCCSSNNYGTACDNFTIASGYIPTIQGRKEITAKINEKTILEVEFASKPVPYILSAYWQKDSQNISGERFTIVSVSDPKLTINNVVSDDDGIYTCIVFNGVGTASVDISLFTWSEPSVSLVWIDDITNITVIGTATSKPDVTHISWKRRVQSTTKPTDFSITTKYRISGTFSSPVLTLFDIQNDVRGTYIICTASNNFSTSYAEMYIPVRDIPFVSAAKTTYHMTIGSSNYLRCNFDSYPKATRLYWLKYPSDNKETLVYNTSITELAFLVQHATGEDAGNYSCCAANSLGYACSSYIALFIREEPKTPKIDTILIIFGIVIGILLVIAIIVVVLTKRRQEHTSQSHYEERDMSTDENHRYGNTRDRSVYYNSQEEVKVDAINTGYDYCWTEGMLERYDVSELKNNLQNKNFFQPRLTAEFRILASPIQEYDYIESDIQRGFGRPDDNRIITIQNGDNCVMISDISNLHNIENFWNIIYERQIENTILLAKKGEMIPELYPTLDDSIEIADLVIEMESAEKINHNIQLLTFKLYNKNTKSAIKIEIFKSYNSKYTDKYPDFDVLSCLVDKVSDRKGNVLLLGSKSFGLRISGVLYVCLDVAKAMKKEGIFNLLESAITAKRNISSVFQDFDEYEMCYTVTEYYLEHYLHHVDTYDYID